MYGIWYLIEINPLIILHMSLITFSQDFPGHFQDFLNNIYLLAFALQ